MAKGAPTWSAEVDSSEASKVLEAADKITYSIGASRPHCPGRQRETTEDLESAPSKAEGVGNDLPSPSDTKDKRAWRWRREAKCPEPAKPGAS